MTHAYTRAVLLSPHPLPSPQNHTSSYLGADGAGAVAHGELGEAGHDGHLALEALGDGAGLLHGGADDGLAGLGAEPVVEARVEEGLDLGDAALAGKRLGAAGALGARGGGPRADLLGDGLRGRGEGVGLLGGEPLAVVGPARGAGKWVVRGGGRGGG
jgi:hypothetical protein